jgi:hypothetical protein
MTRVLYFLLAVLVVACGGARTGMQRVTYPDGRMHYEYQLRDGLPHGLGKVWHSNGELKSEGEYVNGVKHGIFRFFDDDGAFQYHALFYKGAEVWRSVDRSARPSPELLEGLAAFSGSLPRLGVDEVTRPPPPVRDRQVEPLLKLSRDPPAPYFSSLDRTTSLNRVGLQYALGDAGDRPMGAVTRLDLYVNYKFSRLGVYGQLLQANFESAPGMTLSGRRTAELAGTYEVPSPSLGRLTIRGGLLLPIGNDDSAGHIAGTAGGLHRPTDIAASFPSTIALRTSSSITRSHSRFIVQADGGVDWLFGGQSSFDALLRANAGVGVGVRSWMFSLELSNVLRVGDPSRRVHALGAGGTFWIERIWLTLLASSSLEGRHAITGTVGYEL